MLRDSFCRDWNLLSDEAQLALSSEALRRAVSRVAEQAELLAGEMEAGFLADRGGPDALRLLAAVVREVGGCGPVEAGTA
jgi:Mor family transcriptional regulator